MAFRKQQAGGPAGVTVSPKVTSAAKPSSGRNSSCGLFTQDVSLLGFEPGPQTTLKTDFQVTKGLAKSRSKSLPSGKEHREGREGVQAFGLGRQPTQLSGVSHLLGKQSRHRWAPAVIWKSKVLATSKTLWKNPTPNPIYSFFSGVLWLPSAPKSAALITVE